MGKVKISKVGLVVVVDIQEGFSRIVHNGDNEMFLANTEEVLKYFNQNGIKVIFVEYADSGMILSEVYDIIKIQSQKITSIKYDNDAFKSENFKKTLEKESQKVENILFLGLENNHCLLETVESALNLNYNVVVSYELMTGTCALSYNAKNVYKNCLFLDYHFKSKNNRLLELKVT